MSGNSSASITVESPTRTSISMNFSAGYRDLVPYLGAERLLVPVGGLRRAADDQVRGDGVGRRWARDVGAPVRDGGALSLTVRERWRGRAGYPYVRAAGHWLTRTGSLPSGLPVEVEDGDGLLAAALGQLDAGAVLVKRYMDGPDRDSSPFTADEVRRTVEAVYARGPR